MMSGSDGLLLRARGLTKFYGTRIGCRDVDIDIHEGEVVAIVGESGSGKSTLLGLLSTQLEASDGSLAYVRKDGVRRDLRAISEFERRLLLRSEWGFIQQDARLGLRMSISAGGNVGERLMANGWRNYAHIRKRGTGLAGEGRDPTS